MFRDRLHLNIDETIDFGLLSGYMWKLTDVALGAFSVVVNIHPADLTRLGPDGKRIYTGDNAVYKAIKAGELETYSVAHVATKGVDEGPIIVRSRPLFVDETKRADDKAVLKDVAQVHQEKMKSHCDIPAFVKAVELTAAGLVGRNSDGALFYRSSLDSEWAAIPHGYQLGLEEQVMLAQTS
jgi:folate-dependent phosphoribosylglycinamide formyltransferase PurN